MAIVGERTRLCGGRYGFSGKFSATLLVVAWGLAACGCINYAAAPDTVKGKDALNQINFTLLAFNSRAYMSAQIFTFSLLGLKANKEYDEEAVNNCAILYAATVGSVPCTTSSSTSTSCTNTQDFGAAALIASMACDLKPVSDVDKATYTGG